MLKISNFSLKIGEKEILNDINIDFNAGNVVSIVGLNGIGKTTFLNTLCGINSSYNGDIIIDRHKINKIAPTERAQLISYVPQRFGISNNISVLNFVVTGFNPHLKLFEQPQKMHYEQACQELEKLNLLHLKEQSMESLSSGERQFVYLARTLIQDAKIIVFDEPLSNLDFDKQHYFLQVINHLAKHDHKTIILTIHDPNLALNNFDKILIFKDKKIVSIPKVSNWKETYLEQLNKIYLCKFKFADDKQDKLEIKEVFNV